ncbi:MAG: methyl-accepting chemotaxis protein, partial [Candidatus Odinarchaeota archaeon]
LLVLRYLYGDSLFFRLSFYMLLLITLTAYESFLLTTGASFGIYFLLAFAGNGLITMLILYTVYTVKKPIDLLINEVNTVATGDLDVKKEGLEGYGKEFADLENAFMLMTDRLQSIVASIQSAAGRLSTNSEELASSAEEVNASSEEISGIVQQMSRGAQQQAEQINSTINSVEELSKIVGKTVADISATADLIAEVANQTNMLALNAAIEAARAGNYGKGFAVVADNVKRLAEDTKQNSASIQEQVDGIKKQIMCSVEKIATAVDSVAAVAEETAANSEEASAATEEQTATMEEMNSASQELAQLAQDLLDSTSVFKVQSERKQAIQENSKPKIVGEIAKFPESVSDKRKSRQMVYVVTNSKKMDEQARITARN